MKTLKSKYHVLTYLICFSFLAVTQISCENNDDLEEIIEQTDKVKKAEVETMAKGGIKVNRTKLKKRRNGLYRSSVIVKGDNEDQVSTVAFQIEKKEGFIKETKTYYLDYFTTIKGKKHYTFGDIKFENKEIENQEVTVNITLLDAKKEVISKTTELVVVASFSKIRMKKILLKEHDRKKSTKTYKLNTEIEDPENTVAAVELTVTDLKGNSATINTAPKKNNTIAALFGFQKEFIANTFVVISTLKDMFGDVVGESKEEVSLTPNFKIGKVSFSQTSEGLYTALVKIKKDTGNDVDKVTVTVEKGEGIAYKTITYGLTYLKTEKGVKYYTNQKVALIESKVKKIPVVVEARTETDGDGTGLTVIIRERAPRYKGSRG